MWRDGDGPFDERGFLRKLFPGSEWRTMGGRPVFLCQMVTRSGRAYDLRIVLVTGYPEVVPKVFVTRPILVDAAGEPLVFRGADPTMMLAAPESGTVSVAHTKAACWTRRGSALLALTKTRSWLEAYEAHLVTGLPIVSCLRQQLAP